MSLVCLTEGLLGEAKQPFKHFFMRGFSRSRGYFTLPLRLFYQPPRLAPQKEPALCRASLIAASFLMTILILGSSCNNPAVVPTYLSRTSQLTRMNGSKGCAKHSPNYWILLCLFPRRLTRLVACPVLTKASASGINTVGIVSQC